MKKYTKEFLISEFWRFYEENGRYPTSKEMKASKGYPTVDAYKTNWGTWVNFISELDILGENDWHKCDEEVLKELYHEGRQEEILDRLMVKRKWGTIKEKARKMGLKRNMRKVNYDKNSYNKEELIQILKDYHNVYDKVPKREEFKNNKKYPSTKPYVREFGGWNKALIAAGLDTHIILECSREDIINEVKQFYKINGRSPYREELKYKNFINKYWNSINQLLTECNLSTNRRFHDLKCKKDGIIFLKNLYKKLSKVPTMEDVNNYSNVSIDWIISKFGTFRNALYEAELMEVIPDKKERIEINISALKNLAKELNRAPSVEEYEALEKTHKGYSRRILEVNLQMNYRDICVKYLPGYDLSKVYKGEERIHKYFLDNGIVRIIEKDYCKLNKHDLKNNKYYIFQKRYDGLVGMGGGLLSYDFWLPQYNLLIEYQGNFHDRTVKNQTEESFERQKEHDKRKKDYAKLHNINLLEIWYWDYDNIEIILDSYLNNVA